MNSRQERLRVLSRIIQKRNSRWFAALEQSGISAGNFVFSLMVLWFAGVRELGEYGFLYTIAELSTMFVGGVAVNQMVLHVADATVPRQREVLAITLAVIVGLQFLTVFVLWWAAKFVSSSEPNILLAAPLIAYSICFSLAELARQFLYMRGRQRLSLFYAAFSTIIALGLFLMVFFMIRPSSVTALAFWCLAVAQFSYVWFAAISGNAWARKALPSKFQIFETLDFYWSNGRLAAAGMVVTWAQNKSVNPMLIFLMGDFVAGLYQVARMVIMPINMITAGLAKSAMAEVRRAWGEGDECSLNRVVGAQLKISMFVVFVYLALVSVCVLVVYVFDLKPISHSLMLIFISTVLVVVVSNYRFWASYRLVVQLQFAFLLKIGCVGAIITLIWMFVAGSIFDNAALVVLGSAVGELYLLSRIIRSNRSQA